MCVCKCVRACVRACVCVFVQLCVCVRMLNNTALTCTHCHPWRHDGWFFCGQSGERVTFPGWGPRCASCLFQTTPVLPLLFQDIVWTSTHKGVNWRSKDVTQSQQQWPQLPTVTLTLHACKYKVHKLYQRYILKSQNVNSQICYTVSSILDLSAESIISCY